MPLECSPPRCAVVSRVTIVTVFASMDMLKVDVMLFVIELGVADISVVVADISVNIGLPFDDDVADIN